MPVSPPGFFLNQKKKSFGFFQTANFCVSQDSAFTFSPSETPSGSSFLKLQKAFLLFALCHIIYKLNSTYHHAF